MKKLLLMGTALLSMAPYAGAMNSDQKDSKINSVSEKKAPEFSNSITSPSISNNNAPLPPVSESNASTVTNEMTSEEALRNRWETKIAPAVLNKDISLKAFEGSLSEFAEAYKSYNQYPRETLFLNIHTLNLKTREVIDEIHKKLETITNELKNKTTIEMDNIIKEDWEVIRKISLLSQYGFCLSKEGLDEKEIKKDLTSLIDLAADINQPTMKPVYDWFIRNGVYAVLQNTSRFYCSQIYYSLYPSPSVFRKKVEFPWENIIKSSLYSSKDGFDPLAIAVLWPHLIYSKGIVETIPKNINHDAILSDLVKGLIDYMIDIKITKFYPQENSSIIDFIIDFNGIINFLGRNYNLGEVSLCSFDGKESIINMIQRKMQEIQSNEQDKTLSQKRIETLTRMKREILRTIPLNPNLYEAIQQYIGNVDIDSNENFQNTVLEEFKRLTKNLSSDGVKIAINSVLEWIQYSEFGLEKENDILDNKTCQDVIAELTSKKLILEAGNTYPEIRDVYVQRTKHMLANNKDWKSILEQANNLITRIEQLRKPGKSIRDIDQLKKAETYVEELESWLNKIKRLALLIGKYQEEEKKVRWSWLSILKNANNLITEVDNLAKQLTFDVNKERLCSQIQWLKEQIGEYPKGVRDVEKKMMLYSEKTKFILEKTNKMIQNINQLTEISDIKEELLNKTKQLAQLIGEFQNVEKEIITHDQNRKLILRNAKYIPTIQQDPDVEEIMLWLYEIKRQKELIDEYQRKIDLYNKEAQHITPNDINKYLSPRIALRIISENRKKYLSKLDNTIKSKKGNILYNMFLEYKAKIVS